MLRRVSWLTLCLCIFILSAATLHSPFQGANAHAAHPETTSIYGDHKPPSMHKTRGAVSSLSGICNKIGTSMLTRGGNAADAIIAAEFCVGVVGFYDTGLGGGGFALIRRPNGTYETIDFRETAPAAATQNLFNKTNQIRSLEGGLASGIPGNLRGYQYIFENYGSLPWKDLIAPSMNLARNGFAISNDIEFVYRDNGDVSFLENDLQWALDFAPNGTRLGLGERLTRRRYADLLQSIAEDGPDAFYEGSIAKATIAALKRKGGIMTMEDLKNYSVVVQPALHTTYRDFDITTVGAPSSGAVVLNILKSIEGYHDLTDPSLLNLSTHRIDEAMRFGYGARTKLADTSFYPNITHYEHAMFSAETASTIHSRILDSRTQPVSAYNPLGIESLNTPGTSHINAADSNGLAISMTTTINMWFGSGLIVPETGLIMNNEMNDFSIPGVSNAFGYIPSAVNYVAAGKRPLSSMSPVIITHRGNGTLYAMLGGSGGSYIITAVVQAIWHLIDRGMELKEALSVPRWHDQLVPNEMRLEYAFDNATAEFLRARGHKIVYEEREAWVGGIMRLANGTFLAESDSYLRDAKGSAV